MNARVGIFGGTFNPIHLGHLRAAEEVLEALELERMVFVPSAEPPHKQHEAGDPIAPAAERLAWVRAAVADHPRFSVDSLEVDREGPSYSVDTLRVLGARQAPERPVFVVGQDAFADMGSWRDPETVLSLAHLAVITRPPVRKGSLADWLPAGLRGRVELAPDGLSGRCVPDGSCLRLIEITALDISSSDIRRRLREGRSVRYLIPESVREAIEESGVYGWARPA
jgi:nicotinate-nucleotide adenylyltransferase